MLLNRKIERERVCLRQLHLVVVDASAWARLQGHVGEGSRGAWPRRAEGRSLEAAAVLV